MPVYPVAGKVLVGGEVPEGALVVLYPSGTASDAEVRPSAKVGPDGTFRVTTYEADDGAPAGEYTATLQWNKLIRKGGDDVAGPDVVPALYGDRGASPWKVTVSPAPNELPPLEIEVTK